MEVSITHKLEVMVKGFRLFKVYKLLPSGTWKYMGIARGEGQKSLFLADLRFSGFQAKAEEVILENGKYVSVHNYQK